MDPRTARNLQSAEALVELLRSAITRPTEFSEKDDFVSALKSQGALSNYTNSALQINGVSINTLKRVANEHLGGGWSLLDSLRKDSLAAIEKCRQANARDGKKTAAAKADSFAEVSADLQMSWRTNLGLLRVITQTVEDLTIVRSSKSSGERERVIDESIARARASLLSNQPPFDRPETINVVRIDRKQ